MAQLAIHKRRPDARCLEASAFILLTLRVEGLQNRTKCPVPMVTRSYKRTSSALVLSERGKLSAHLLRRLSGPSLPEPHHTRHDIHSWLAPYHCLATLHPLRLTRRLLAQITRCRKNFVGLLIGIRRSTARGSQCRVPSDLMSLSSTLTPMQTYTFIQKHSLPRKV